MNTVYRNRDTHNHTGPVFMETRVTETIPKTSTSGELEVFGYPGSDFYAIHITAIVSLSVSIIVSACVLVYLLTPCFSGHSAKSFFKRPVGDRLVVYLAVADLGFSISHELDHWYMFIIFDHPPDSACVTFAFFLQTFMLAQSFVIVYTAVSVMVLVVFEKKIGLGRYDWRLFVLTLGVPVCIGIAGISVPFLGPSGPWCIIDMRKSYGALVNNMYGIVFLTIFFINVLCYGAVGIKIHKVGKGIHSSQPQGLSGVNQDKNRYMKTAKMMMVFVTAYLFQWWSFVVQSIWGMFEVPAIWIFVTVVLLVNLGGVFNALAYTVLRRIMATKHQPGSTCNTLDTKNMKKFSPGLAHVSVEVTTSTSAL